MGEEDLFGHVASIHLTLLKHQQHVDTIMMKIKPSFFSNFTKKIVLEYLEGV
jgi:hypothetical protein